MKNKKQLTQIPTAHREEDDHNKDKDKYKPDPTTTTTTTTTTKTYQFFRTKPDTCLGGDKWSPGGPPANRHYANEHIEVRESPLQGHGVFAAADVREGTEVLMEAPLLRAKGSGGLAARHARLGDEERAVYDGLVGYHEWETCPVRQKWSANA
jgi:hypothetical protein